MRYHEDSRTRDFVLESPLGLREKTLGAEPIDCIDFIHVPTVYSDENNKTDFESMASVSEMLPTAEPRNRKKLRCEHSFYLTSF